MGRAFFVVLVLFVFATPRAAESGWVPPTYNETVIAAFRAKRMLGTIGNLTRDPYAQQINTSLGSNSTVCAVQYPQHPDRSVYRLATFPSASAARENGSFVTHQHACGKCSTLQDLS